MNNNDDLARQILRGILALPMEQQAEAILNILGSAVNVMTSEELAAMKREIESTFSPESLRVSIVRESLEVIDGALALREMEKGE